MGSDHGCDCKGSRDDIQTGGGEGWGHITDATTKGAGMTYILEVERERNGYDMDATTKGAEMTYNLEAERERDGFGSRMRLQREQG